MVVEFESVAGEDGDRGGAERGDHTAAGTHGA
jgi:hypothetical protein